MATLGEAIPKRVEAEETVEAVEMTAETTTATTTIAMTAATVLINTRDRPLKILSRRMGG